VHLDQAGAIAAIAGAVALFPVNAVLVDAPITHTSNSGIRNGRASSDDLTPTTVPWRINGEFKLIECNFALVEHSSILYLSQIKVKVSCIFDIT